MGSSERGADSGESGGLVSKVKFSRLEGNRYFALVALGRRGEIFFDFLEAKVWIGVSLL
jgi:hypothetical protein